MAPISHRERVPRPPALLFLLALPVLAEEASFDPLLAEVEKIQGEEGLINASLGFAVIALDAPEPSAVAGYHLDTALLPASTLKVVTTVSALELLGPEFRFVTTLQHTGEITAEGTLRGDLVVKGGGDPTLADTKPAATFERWHCALIGKGIKRIEGRVIGDDSLFGTQLRPDGWQWNDLGNYYAAGASGLTFHQNQFFCHFQTGEAGTPAGFLGTDPELPGVTIVNEMRVGPADSGDQGYVYGSSYSTVLYLRGTVPAGGERFTIRGALPDPALFCAQAFTRHLADRKIEITGPPTTARLLTIAGEAVGPRHDLLEEHSAPLPELITVTNTRSDNLYAECLHRLIGIQAGGGGSTAAGTRAIEALWKAKGIDLTGFEMADGCGLSRLNSITARQMTQLLYHAAKSEHFELFFKSLPVAGQSGTLRNIGAGSPSADQVHAKSGSIERVKSYCGYIDAKSGKRYAFALFINRYTGDLPPLKEKIIRLWDQIAAL